MTTQPRDETSLVRTEAPGELAPAESPLVETMEGVHVHKYNLRPPVVRLVQAQSAEGTAGKFLRLDTKEQMDTLSVVPIRVVGAQTYWGPGGFSRDRKPLCWSMNGVQAAKAPRLDGVPPLYPGQLCAKCPVYWDPRRGGSPPEDCCPSGSVVLFVDAITYEPYLMRLSGTSAWLDSVFGNRTLARQAVFVLSSRHVVGKRGTWFALAHKVERRLDEKQRAEIEEVYQSYRAMDVARETQEQEEDEGPQVVGAGEAAPPVPEAVVEAYKSTAVMEVEGVVTSGALMTRRDGKPFCTAGVDVNGTVVTAIVDTGEVPGVARLLMKGVKVKLTGVWNEVRIGERSIWEIFVSKVELLALPKGPPPSVASPPPGSPAGPRPAPAGAGAAAPQSTDRGAGGLPPAAKPAGTAAAPPTAPKPSTQDLRF